MASSGSSGASERGEGARWERLATQDSSFLHFEQRRTHMHVAALGLFEAGPLRRPDGGLDIERVRAHAASRLHQLPRYRQRLVFTPLERHPVWVDDPRFNLEYHVRHTCLPRPGDETALKELAGRILSQQLDREKPLWEMWTVEGLEGDRFAMLTKVHHCMVDGVAGMDLLARLLSASPDASVEPARPWSPRPAPGALRLLADAGLRRARVPWVAARALGEAALRPRETWRDVGEALGDMGRALGDGFRLVHRAPHNRPIGTHRRVDWATLDLATVKDVGRRLGGTVNDVILAVVTGAVRRFFQQRGEKLAPDYRIVIPVSLREAGAEAGASGNRVSAWFLSLPIAEDDPRERLCRIREETARLKASGSARGMDHFTRIVDWTGSTLLTWAGVRLAARVHPYNLIVTNVRGPQQPLYLLGARLLEFHPQVPLFEEQGLGVAVVSYADRVCIGLTGDWDVMPDLAEFAEALRESARELSRTAAQDGAREAG